MMASDFVNCRDAVFVLEVPPREPRQATPRIVRERREPERGGRRHVLAWCHRLYAPPQPSASAPATDVVRPAGSIPSR